MKVCKKLVETFSILLEGFKKKKVRSMYGTKWHNFVMKRWEVKSKRYQLSYLKTAEPTIIYVINVLKIKYILEDVSLN